MLFSAHIKPILKKVILKTLIKVMCLILQYPQGHEQITEQIKASVR
jgi:hypothetical protein